MRIVNRLATGGDPVCGCELNGRLGLAQPTVSHHVKKLAMPACSSGSSAASGPTSRREARRGGKLAAVADLKGGVLLMSTERGELREEVRARYAEAARGVVEGCELRMR